MTILHIIILSPILKLLLNILLLQYYCSGPIMSASSMCLHNTIFMISIGYYRLRFVNLYRFLYYYRLRFCQTVTDTVRCNAIYTVMQC